MPIKTTTKTSNPNTQPETEKAWIPDNKTPVDSAGGAIPGLESGLTQQGLPVEIAAEVKIAAGDAFTDGAKFSAWAAAGFLLLGLFSTFNLGTRRKKEKV